VTLARRYFQRISAPKKAFILFADSAHFPMYEEPHRFAKTMRAIAASLHNSRSPHTADLGRGSDRHSGNLFLSP
jgi:alpha-beta hydrolase superfamily lysophospholipase